MSVSYRAVDWNPQKKRYDLALAGLLVLGITAYVASSAGADPGATAETLILRATSFSALGLLHVILCIGPLARLSTRFNGLLYNRRHLGVTMFALAFVHGAFAIIQYHAGGDANPLTSALTAYAKDYNLFRAEGGLAHVPFEPFGMAALAILFVMAATSHDFWLRTLGSATWKLLHLGVYLTYGLVLVHVALGFLQTERSPVYPALLGIGLACVATLHLLAGWREWHNAVRAGELNAAGYVATCGLGDLREGRACVVSLGEDRERAAVWLHEGRVFATSNVCRHQGGPLGEGRILNGCVTCPWHGWNYKVDTGMSPPPFAEVIPTYEVAIHQATVYVKPEPNPLRTTCKGASVRPGCDHAAATAAKGASASESSASDGENQEEATPS